MRLRPNDSPPMEVGEVRNFTFKLAPAVGSNTLSSPEASSERLTVGTPTITGTDITVAVTATRAGTHPLKVKATLATGEIVIGVIRVKVVDSYECAGADGYGH